GRQRSPLGCRPCSRELPLWRDEGRSASVHEAVTRCDHAASGGHPGRNRSRGGEIVGGATVSVAVVASRTEAELIVGLLRSHGGSAGVAAGGCGGRDP